MISWKYSLEKINGELELAKKKKEALDKLFDEGKVSQPTYNSFSDEVSEAIAEIESKQNALVEKMKAKISELEQQMKTLEYLLVNSEIRHVSGELEEDAYNRECNVLSLGLETTREELNEIKGAISNLSEGATDLPQPPSMLVEEDPAQIEPETEKRLEIVMDTETTTSVETTTEERPAIEETEEQIEQVEEQEEKEEALVEEGQETARQEEEKSLSEEAEAAETAGDTEEAQEEVLQEAPTEEETEAQE